jgi:hypothetical protein
MTIDHECSDATELRCETDNNTKTFLEDVIKDKKVQCIATIEPFSNIGESFAFRIASAIASGHRLGKISNHPLKNLKPIKPSQL